MANLIDVARHAGVSPATVSRVLRGLSRIAPATRARVLNSVEALNYAPNPIGQALRAGHVNTVALLVGDIEQGWYAGLARSVQAALEPAGFDLLLFNLGHSEARLRQILSRAVSMRLRGIALAMSDRFPVDDLAPLLARLSAASIPLIALGRRLDAAGVASIVHADREGSCQALDLLARRGRTPVAFLSHIERSATGRERFEGYVEGLSRIGQPFDPALVWDPGDAYRFEAGYRAMRDAIERRARVRAVLAGSDELALGAMAAALDAGLNVPDDIAFVGFGDLGWTAYTRPSLTTLTADTDRFGPELCRLLAPAPPDFARSATLLPIERRLVVRGSV